MGFFGSTVVLWHTTFSVNSLAHMVGRRRYATNDASRNLWPLALVTFGEGWHNHHHYPASARQGFTWWQLDITYLLLRSLAWARIVHDLRQPSPAALAARRVDQTRQIESPRARAARAAAHRPARAAVHRPAPRATPWRWRSGLAVTRTSAIWCTTATTASSLGSAAKPPRRPVPNQPKDLS